MQTYRIVGRTTDIQTTIQKIYVDKTLKKLSKLKNDKKFSIYFTQNLTVNGKNFHPLNDIEKMLPELVQKLLTDDAEKFFW